mgnify:CR=1 FL=1
MVFDFNLNNINDTIDQIKSHSESYRNSPAPRGVRHQANYSLYDNQGILISEGTLFISFKTMVVNMRKIKRGSLHLSLTSHPKY